MPSILNPWVLLGLFLSLSAAFGFGVYSGHHYGWLQEQAVVATEAKQVVQDVIAQDATTQKVETAAAEKQEQIRIVYRTITKEVRKYVPIEVDKECVVPAGFVRVWNGAATGTAPVPGGPGELDDRAPSGTQLSDIEQAHTDDGQTYQRVAQQLRALQAWVRDQQTNDQTVRVRP